MEEDRQEFTLEDIIKEFGDGAATPEEIAEETVVETAEETAEEVAEAAQEELPQVSQEETIRMEPIPAETIRMDAIPEAPAHADVSSDKTIRIDTAEVKDETSMEAETIRMEPVTSDTIRLDTAQFAHVETEIAQPVQEHPEEELQEAFSDQWEPEYEQPMGEYVPPQPTVFQPQSRLKELKKKLVNGPERRYYELSETGVGKLQVAIVTTLIITLICAGISVLYLLNKVPADRTKLLVFGQLFLMLIAALPGSFQLIEGLADLGKKRFTLNTLLVITFVACCVDAAFCLQSLRVPCCAAFSLEMLMSLWSAYHKRHAEIGMMDTMRKATMLDKLSPVPDYYEGKTGLLRQKAQVDEFMKTYDAPSAPERVQNWYAFGALVVSVALAILAGVLYGSHEAAQVLAVSLLAAVPATMFVTLTRPWALLEKQLHKLGTVLCGWQGVAGLKGKFVYPVSHEDMFPTGSAKMNGVKFFGNRQSDEIIACCASLVMADGGGLSEIFSQLLESRNGRHYPVESLRSYPGGIGGEVNSEPVLVGTISLMHDMGVEVPEGIRINQAVCVAIDGELCGLFAVTYEKTRSAVMGLNSLCAYRSLKPVLTNGDFMLTPGFLRGKLGIHPKKIMMPDYETCQELREKELPEDAPALVITTKAGLASLACGAAGAKTLRTTSILGLVIHILGGVIGLTVMGLLTVMGRLDLLTPVNMFLYQLVWLIPGLLITQWTNTI